MHRKSILEDSMQKKCVTPNRVNIFILPVADGTAKMFGRDHGVREPTLKLEEPAGSEDLSGKLQGELEGLNRQNQKMTQKPGKTFGLFKVTSSIAITTNFEFNSMYRRKKDSLFH